MTEPLRALGTRAADITAQAVTLASVRPIFAPQLYAVAACAAGVALWCAALAVAASAPASPSSNRNSTP